MLLILIDLVQAVHVYQSRTEQSNGPHGYIKPMAVTVFSGTSVREPGIREWQT